MAEYAGLEIRIGGNTTSLNKALESSTKSAAELQRRIRQATNAMQFDPTSLSNVDTRIKLTGDRMQSLQSKIQIARTAMEQLGDSMVVFNGEDRRVSEIAAQTRNLSLEAKNADARFVELRDSLATVYEVWNNAARTRGVDFMNDALHIDKKTAASLMSADASLDTLLTTIKEINDARRAGLMEGPIIEPDQIEAIKQLKQINFHGMFEQGAGLDELVEQAQSLGVVIDNDVVDAVHNMREAFVSAQRDKEALDKALEFERVGNDIQRFESEVEGLSTTIRRLDDGLTEVSHSDPFQQLEERMRTVDAALDNVNSDLERTEAALKLDPGNVDLAVRRYEDLRQQVELAAEKEALLQQQIDMLDANGVSEAAAAHSNLAEWVEESAEAARNAQKEWSDQQATVVNLDNSIKKLQEHIAMLGNNNATASMTEQVQRWLTKTQQLDEATQRVEQRTEYLENVQGSISGMQGKLARLNEEYDAQQSKIADLRQEYERLQEAVQHSDDFDSFEAFEAATNRIAEIDEEIQQLNTDSITTKRSIDQMTEALARRNVDLEDAEKQLRQAKTDVETLAGQVQKLEGTGQVQAFKDFPGEAQRSREALEQLESEYGEALVKEKQLGSAYTAAKTENELAKTANKLQEVQGELSDTKVGAKEAAEALKDMNVGSIIQPSTLKTIGMTLSATVTPILTGIGYKMVDASSTVDAAYRDMRKTVNGTEQDFERLRTAAIEFSRTHVTSADQILQIEAIGGELGVATDSLQTFAEVISNIDVSTNLDTETAATALGHLANILHLTEDDYVGFSDALVRLGNNGASTETEIVNIAERIGSMGAIVGMSASDVLAWASSIASTGQNAEAAGTAISKTMSFFETAVAAAGGTLDASFGAIDAAVQEGGANLVVFSNLMGQTADEFTSAWESDPQAVFAEISESVEGAKKSLQGIADVAHMNADEFARAWESDPTAAMEAFIKGLNDIEASGGSADSVLQNFGITSVRQKQAIEGLMQTIGGLDDNLKMSEDAWNGITDQWGQAGDAANEAAKKAEGFSGQIQILKNMAQIALSELGEGAVPIIKNITSMLEGLTKQFTNASDSTKQFIVMAGGFTALLGPTLSLIATGMNTFNNVKDWSAKAFDAVARVRAAFVLGGDSAVAALSGTITMMDKFKIVAAGLATSIVSLMQVAAVVGGVVALGLALKMLYDDWKTHQQATEGLSDALKHIGISASDASTGIEDTASRLHRLVEESGDYEERLADLAGAIEESNDEYGNYAGRMEAYESIIEELAGKTDRTKEETAKLAAALEAVNEQCGTSYAIDEYGNVIDTLTGKVMDNTDAITNNIEMRKQQALIDAYADDYAQALDEYADAQARLNELEEQHAQLTSEEGHQAFIDDYLENHLNNVEQAEQVYGATVYQTEQAMAEAREEMDRTDEVLDTLSGRMDVAKTEMNDLNREFEEQARIAEEAAKAEEEYAQRVDTVTSDTTGNMSRLSAAVTDAGKSDAVFNDIAEGLESIHVYADELDGVDMASLVSAFDNVDGSMAQVIETLQNAGVATDTWNAALEAAPEAVEHLGSIGADAFAAMYEAAGEDIYATMELIAGLNEMEIDGKTFFVGDDGTIVDEEGRVYDLQNDLADIPDEVITELTGDDTDLRDKLIADKRELEAIGSMTVTPTISVTDYASSTIDWISSKLTALGNKRTNTVITSTTQAKGGMNSRPVIPRHATGYIATGPTFTNQGWIGEDGVEAVANWATGGAVVPLTNKRYMLPIADAIASGIAARGYGMGGDNITIHLNYEAGTDATALVRDLARQISMHKAMRGRW